MLLGLQASSVSDRSTQLTPEQSALEDTVAARNIDIFDNGPFSITTSVLLTAKRQQCSRVPQSQSPLLLGRRDISASSIQVVGNA